MCELHYYRCTTCGLKWTAHKKLASCDSPDAEARCPPSLCMYVGNQRRPRKGECDVCKNWRESVECSADEESEAEAPAKDVADGQAGGGAENGNTEQRGA